VAVHLPSSLRKRRESFNGTARLQSCPDDILAAGLRVLQTTPVNAMHGRPGAVCLPCGSKISRLTKY
jgi:hypothetical protein